MEVKDFQNKIVEFVSAWDKKRNSNPNEQLTFNHIVEEIGELAREYVNQESRKDRFSKDELEDAIGDTLMQLVKLASLRNIDIEDLINMIIKKEQPLLES
ncbi:MAG: MazG-like family protein [Patescibacteria group bacterium]|nr:MazG-like family protein [Patescibacteria group bacterium]